MKSLSIIFVFILLLHAVSCPQSTKASHMHPGIIDSLLPSFGKKLLPQTFPESPMKMTLSRLKSDKGKYRPIKIVMDSSSFYSYTYDKKGFPAFEYGEYYDDGVLAGSHRCSRIYDNNGNLVAEVYKGYSDGQWINSARMINTYNNNNRILTHSWESWNDNAWLKVYRYTYTYGTDGNPESYLFEYFYEDPVGMGVWTNVERYTYAYDNNGNLLSDLIEIWQDGAWLSNYRRAYTYDKDKLLSVVLEIFYEGSWRYSSRTKNTYDAGGNLVSYLWEIYLDGSWRNHERNTYSYDNNNLLIGSLTEKWKNNAWVNFSRYSRTSSVNGSTNMNLWELWKSNAWTDSSKSIETFDLNGNTIKAESFDWKSNSWIPSRSALNFSYNQGKDHLEYIATSVEVEYEYLKSEDRPAVYEFSLSQNYPNPFNPSTTINYSVKQDGVVRLSVYNILGSRVAVILDAYKSAGEYSIRFDGTGFPCGVYFYTLESGGGTLTKKFILLK